MLSGPRGHPSEVSALFQVLARARSRFLALPRPRRELFLFGICLLGGLLVVPWVIWIIGEAVLGEYASGGPFALLGDYFVALFHGSLVHWAVALGPYAFLCIGRLLIHWMRSGRATPRTASRTG